MRKLRKKKIYSGMTMSRGCPGSMENRLLLRSLSGFTLVESLLTVLIFAVIMGASYVAFSSGVVSWQINNVQLELQQELRKAMDQMAEDLRQGGSTSVTDVPADGTWYTTISFAVAMGVSGGAIQWSSDDVQFILAGSNSNELHRNEGAANKIVATNIQTLQIRRQSATPNIVEVSLQAQKNTPRGDTVTMNSDFSVKLRN